MTSQFDLTRFYEAIIRNSVLQLGFLTREFQISQTTRVKMGEESIKSMKWRTQTGVTLNEYICVQEGWEALKNWS